MENKEVTPVLKKDSAIRAPPGTKVCVITKKELEELKRTNKLKQTDPTKSPNVFLIKQQICDKLRTTEPNKKFILKQVVRTADTQGSGEKKPLMQVVQQKKPVKIVKATLSGNKISVENNTKETAEQKKGVIFKTKIISNSRVKVTETDVKKIFTASTPRQSKRLKTDDDDVKFKPNGRPTKTYSRNPDAVTITDSFDTSNTDQMNEQTPVKRRRGRPRGNKSNSVDEDWSPNKTSGKKRKRSYRKKTYDDWSSSYEDEDYEIYLSSDTDEEDMLLPVKRMAKSEGDKPKRKRGRPRKQKDEQKDQEDEKNKSIDEGSTEELTPKAPKKRGRPRKVAQREQSPTDVEGENENSEEQEVSSADEALPLTRTRSRRNINYFELANPKSLDEWAGDKRQPDKKDKFDEKLEKDKEQKATTKVTKIVITEKRVTPGYVEIGFCAKDLNEQDHEIVQQEEDKGTDDDTKVEDNLVSAVKSKEDSMKVIKSSDEGKSGEVIYVIQQINKTDVEKSENVELKVKTDIECEEKIVQELAETDNEKEEVDLEIKNLNTVEKDNSNDDIIENSQELSENSTLTETEANFDGESVKLEEQPKEIAEENDENEKATVETQVDNKSETLSTTTE